MMKTFTIAVILLLLTYYACDKNLSQYLLIENLKATWELQQMVDKNTNIPDTLPPGYSADVTFNGDNCVAVNAPCNTGGGKYDVDGSRIRILHLAMTKRACPLLDFEHKFTTGLTGSYSIEGNKLTIISDNNVDMTFIKSDSTRHITCFNF